MNNFNDIKKYLIFKSADDFYVLFIKKRRKDNPGLEHGEIEISTFYITSVSELENLMPLISSICEATNSRAYINLNTRSFRSVALHTNKKLGEILVSGDYKYARKIYESESNSHTNTDDKKWIIDFDYEDGHGCSKNDLNTFDEMIKFIEKEQRICGNEPLSDIIKTKFGVHVVTRPFRINRFKEKYPNIDVHKEPVTLCYIF